jgi:hypothetical protein
VWTAPPEYVILMKMEYWRDGGSEKHLRDIRAMLRILGPDIDRAMIEAEASQRGVATRVGDRCLARRGLNLLSLVDLTRR